MSAERRTRTVVVVDDSTSMLFYLGTVLKRLGCKAKEPGMGLKFIEISDAGRELIRQFIRSRLTAELDAETGLPSNGASPGSAGGARG